MHSEITTTTLTISFIIITSFCGVFATLYTRCNNLTGVGYQHEALFSDICETLIEATAQCLNNSLCDLISKNGSQCSFHTAINRNVTCGTGGVISIGDVSIDRFRSCNCLLIPEIWVETGPFFLYVTPETYYCYKGQDACMSLDGIMAEFYSIDELNYALTYVTETVFVGGQRWNGTFVWSSTKQEINGNLWSPGEPYEGAPCVQIWRQQNALDDTWPTVLRPVLCQMRLQ